MAVPVLTINSEFRAAQENQQTKACSCCAWNRKLAVFFFFGVTKSARSTQLAANLRQSLGYKRERGSDIPCFSSFSNGGLLAAFVAAFLSICLCKLGFNRKEVEQSKPIEENGAKIKGVDEDYGTIEEGREAGGSGGRGSN